MKRNKRKNNKVLVLLLALVAFISIGYAAISTNLQINGGATVGKPSWDIHFENINVKTGSVTTEEGKEAKIIKDTKNEDTIVTYTVNLEKPGDFYEFSVDVVNAGTLTGKLVSLGDAEGAGLTEEYTKFVKYTVTYKDKDDNTVAADSTLAKEQVNTVTVRVEFDANISNDVLKTMPSTGLTLDLSYELNYEQA